MSSDPVTVGTRVQIGYRLLTASQRAPGLPADTAALSYEMRARGILLEPGRLGEPVSIRTPTGRRLTGTLIDAGPADTHSFGRPPQALVAAIESITALRAELE